MFNAIWHIMFQGPVGRRQTSFVNIYGLIVVVAAFSKQETAKMSLEWSPKRSYQKEIGLTESSNDHRLRTKVLAFIKTI